MPRNSLYLHIRLQVERDKLVDWAILANLSDKEETLTSGLQLNIHKLNGALQNFRLVLLDLTKLTEWHDLGHMNAFHALDRSLHESPRVSPLKLNSSLQKKAISFAESTRIFPREVRWKIFEKKAFELLLAKLAALNQNMAYFFEQRQQELQFQMHENAFMGIIQAHDRLDDLIDVMASLKATSLYRPNSPHEQRLLQLARFKAFQLAITGAGDFEEERIRDYLDDPPSPYPSRILLENDRYIDGEEHNLSDYEPVRTWGTFETVPVWVEWRYCEFCLCRWSICTMLFDLFATTELT